VKQITWIRFFR